MNLRHSIFFAALIVAFATVLLMPNASGAATAFLLIFVVGNLLSPQSKRLCVTLTVSEILADVLEAFKTRVPALKMFAHDFSNDRVKYGQTVIAHLPTIPTAYDHVAANGYNGSAQNARDLLTDVPIVINGWKDVPIKIIAADAAQDRSENYLKTIANAGYVLGKAVVDFALTKVLAANFTGVTTEAAANVSKQTLSDVRRGMNLVHALTPRNMLCNSEFFAGLDGDARISSGDYYDQRVGADPFGRLVNCSGFSEIIEYPDFPTNGENLSAFAFDERAIGIATRLPMDSTDLARQLGIPVTYDAQEIVDKETGLAIAAFSWIDPNTHYIYITASVMYGAVAGSQAGAAHALTDDAGWRVRTSA